MIRVVRAKPQDVIDLRHRILRAGLPRDTAIFEGDAEPTTIHLIAQDDSSAAVGCVTILQRPWNDSPAWQLRGMAVEWSRQRGGVGSKLISEVERIVRSDSYSKLLWCNARTPAAKFYEKHGWVTASAVFEIPTAGPHVKMTRRL